MRAAQTANGMSPGLQKVAERARSDRTARFTSLAHYINPELLRSAFARLRRGSAVGIDGVSKWQYGEALDQNLESLHERLRQGKYRHQAVRRVNIPKAGGGTRPLGIACTEDKIVQTAVRDVLEAVYEQDFLDCSYGFRPKRKAHRAIRDLRYDLDQGRVRWILEADLQNYFGSIDRTMLQEMLRARIVDTSILRLIGKCLHVGILEGESYTEPETGTVQGSTLSPMLGNIYLHHALDLWFENHVRGRLDGYARLWRFADDFVLGFERQADAERVAKALGAQMARFGLQLHPEKTRLIDFQQPSKKQTRGKGNTTFDFLGFTFHWRRTRRGRWVPDPTTRSSRLHRAMKAINDFCRRQRHKPIAEQSAGLARKLRGHYNYFGVQGNIRRLLVLHEWTKRTWYKWLNRRGHRRSYTWPRFEDMLRDFPLPEPRVKVQIWA